MVKNEKLKLVLIIRNKCTAIAIKINAKKYEKGIKQDVKELEEIIKIS